MRLEGPELIRDRCGPTPELIDSTSSDIASEAKESYLGHKTRYIDWTAGLAINTGWVPTTSCLAHPWTRSDCIDPIPLDLYELLALSS